MSTFEEPPKVIVPESKKPPKVDPEAEAAYYDTPPPTRCHTCWNITAYCTCVPVDQISSDQINRVVTHSLLGTRVDIDRAAGGNAHDLYVSYLERGLITMEDFANGDALP